MTRDFLVRPFAVLACLLTTACFTTAGDTDLRDEDIERVAPENIGPVVLEADRAFVGENEFFVRYQANGTTIYSGGVWNEREDLAENTGLGNNGGEDELYVPPVLPLSYHQLAEWNDKPEEARSIRILPASDWIDFRTRLLGTLPEESGRTGIVVTGAGVEYFIYYDRQRVLRGTAVENKPPNIPIGSSLSFEEIVNLGIPALKDYIVDKGIDDNEIVFNTGDTGINSLPFVYANFDLDLMVFARFTPQAKVPDTGVENVQTAGHLARSFSWDLLIKPVSSVNRLFFYVADTTVDVVKPTTTVVGVDANNIPPVSDGPGMDLVAWEEELTKITGSKPTAGTMKLLLDGEGYFPRMIEAMQAAEESIYIRTYIFDNDDYAIKIADILRERSEEVKVKVLVDGLGTIMATKADPESLPMGYEAPASVREYLENDSKVKVRQTGNPWLTGDHVKTTIIDKRLAFVGGMNIGREYRYDWHDLMVEVEGPVVSDLLERFDETWALEGPFGDLGYATSKLKVHMGEDVENQVPMRVLRTVASDSEIYRTQLRAIRRAQRYIYIQNAYFADDAILAELIRARGRGVDVRVILPMQGNHGPLNASNVIAANTMLKYGIRVFIYPGMSHVKAAVYDGWLCFGSANFDKLSFRVNKEINLATSDVETVARLEKEIFQADFERSPELTEPLPSEFKDRLLEIVADFL